jgi:hypothetical protein
MKRNCIPEVLFLKGKASAGNSVFLFGAEWVSVNKRVIQEPPRISPKSLRIQPHDSAQGKV